MTTKYERLTKLAEDLEVLTADYLKISKDTTFVDMDVVYEDLHAAHLSLIEAINYIDECDMDKRTKLSS